MWLKTYLKKTLTLLKSNAFGILYAAMIICNEKWFWPQLSVPGDKEAFVRQDRLYRVNVLHSITHFLTFYFIFSFFGLLVMLSLIQRGLAVWAHVLRAVGVGVYESVSRGVARLDRARGFWYLYFRIFFCLMETRYWAPPPLIFEIFLMFSGFLRS